MQNDCIEKIITAFTKIPGFTRKAARRSVIHLLQNKQTLVDLCALLQHAYHAVMECETCGSLDTSSPCSICLDRQRNRKLVCIVESVGDIWAIEKIGVFKGVYHVLGGMLSAIDGVTPEKLRLRALKDRIVTTGVTEVVLAISSTLDGQTTAYYIADMLGEEVKVSRLALGIPIGASLQYMDEGTLSIAINNRESF